MIGCEICSLMERAPGGTVCPCQCRPECVGPPCMGPGCICSGCTGPECICLDCIWPCIAIIISIMPCIICIIAGAPACSRHHGTVHHHAALRLRWPHRSRLHLSGLHMLPHHRHHCPHRLHHSLHHWTTYHHAAWHGRCRRLRRRGCLSRWAFGGRSLCDRCHWSGAVPKRTPSLSSVALSGSPVPGRWCWDW